MKKIQKDKPYIPIVPRHSIISVTLNNFFCIFLLIYSASLSASEDYKLSGIRPDLLGKGQIANQESLQKRVEFWIKIYRDLSLHQIVVHDAKYLDHVYEVVTTPKVPEKSGYYILKSKEKWRRVLLSLHRRQGHLEKLSSDEKRIVALFQDIHEPHKYLNAAHRKRLRAQFGQRERFCEGLRDSAPLLSPMEAIFNMQRLPVTLTRLPFVESSFNLRAKSKVGASGIWQFIKSTAQLYIKVNDLVDERNDPILATGAAAQLLKANYDSLGNWPLAVTAYNHGRKGVMRAARKVGTTDLEEIISEYHQRSFGFASSHFFSELLAVLDVQQTAEKYFGPLPPTCGRL